MSLAGPGLSLKQNILSAFTPVLLSYVWAEAGKLLGRRNHIFGPFPWEMTPRPFISAKHLTICLWQHTYKGLREENSRQRER